MAVIHSSRRWWRLAITSSVTSVAVAVALLGAAPARLAAQSPLVIAPGTELRVTLRGDDRPSQRGRVVVLAGDTLVLSSGELVSRTPIAAIAALEVRGGEDKRRGMLIGAGIAAGITGVVGGIDLGKGEISRDDFVGTMIGNALIGALLGYAFAPKGWERIPLP